MEQFVMSSHPTESEHITTMGGVTFEQYTQPNDACVFDSYIEKIAVNYKDNQEITYEDMPTEEEHQTKPNRPLRTKRASQDTEST